MRPPTSADRSPRYLRITFDTESAQRKRMHDAVAHRALQIGQGSCGSGLGLLEWRRAESEVLKPLDCGFLVSNDKIRLSADISCFEEGEIEICVEPRTLAICGKERVRVGATNASPEKKSEALTFRTRSLPVDIDPRQVTARIKGSCLEVDLPKARATQLHSPTRAA